MISTWSKSQWNDWIASVLEIQHFASSYFSPNVHSLEIVYALSFNACVLENNFQLQPCAIKPAISTGRRLRLVVESTITSYVFDAFKSSVPSPMHDHISAYPLEFFCTYSAAALHLITVNTSTMFFLVPNFYAVAFVVFANQHSIEALL